MGKSLVTYKKNLPAKKSNLGWVIGLVLIGLVVWLLIKNKIQNPASQGSYSNKEEWSVEYNSDGLPTKIVISRNAVRQ